MGSGSRRNKLDNIKIVPKKAAGGGGSGARGSGEHEQVSCPYSIEIKNLPNNPILLDGATVTLEKQNNHWSLFIGLIKIIDLSQSRQKQIESCVERGFSYAGRVKSDKDGKKYVELRRVSI